MPIKIGIIGGSGLYEIEGITDVKEHNIDTPFGKPSHSIITGNLEGVEVVFLPRHGKGHTISPSEINYRANIFALKKLGVQAIISVSAVGSMKVEYKPGDIVIVDQFFDHTKNRISSFFRDGIVAHVSLAEPVCPKLSNDLYNTTKSLNLLVHKGGTYICMEGPQFSTKAESNIYRKWGVDVIGMTNVPECKLAREAEICYSTMAFVTDYDCWHEEEEAVSVDMVIKTLKQNVENAKKIIKKYITSIKDFDTCSCRNALDFGILTSSDAVSEKIKKDLSIIIKNRI